MAYYSNMKKVTNDVVIKNNKNNNKNEFVGYLMNN